MEARIEQVADRALELLEKIDRKLDAPVGEAPLPKGRPCG